MPTELIKATEAPKTIVNVAVAVIHYQQQYLLGFRHQAQHQGNRYEFVGGKIDSNERAVAALIREVGEETGIDISDNVSTHMTVKLGRLHHDYGDKQVCLQVYRVELTAAQYEQHKHCRYGLEGQALTWVSKSALLAGDYPLPAANQTILAWLQLPAQIVITYPLAHFGTQNDAPAAWLQYHQQHIPKRAWVYIRLKSESPEHSEGLAVQLMALRPDIHSVLPVDDISQLSTIPNQAAIPNQITACHLTHTELMQWFHYSIGEHKYNNKERHYIPLNRPLIISCHDTDSINAANLLAVTRLEQQHSPVIGIFLSPVLATKTHPDDTPLGWEAWSTLAELADLPVIALGGLSPSLSKQATQYGATSIAGIRQFLGH